MVEVKQKNFRFSRATHDNLKELVALGIVRNETEAIDLAIMHFLTEKKTELRFRAPGGNEALGMGGAWEFLKPPGENIQLL